MANARGRPGLSPVTALIRHEARLRQTDLTESADQKR